MEKSKIFSKPVIIIFGIVFAALVFGPSYFFYSKYSEAQKQLKDPSAGKKEEVKSLIEKIGKLIELPTGEEPTIATVSDRNSLPPQPFFAKAVNGDQVLIYSKAKKAILYRPSINKIIEVGPVTFEPTVSPSVSPTGATSQSKTTPTPSVAEQVTVAIYNASKTAGLAASTEAKLKSKFPAISIVQKSNSQEDYLKSRVVDLSNQNSETASQIAAFLGAEIGSIPENENKPISDILVVVVN